MSVFTVGVKKQTGKIKFHAQQLYNVIPMAMSRVIYRGERFCDVVFMIMTLSRKRGLGDLSGMGNDLDTMAIESYSAGDGQNHSNNEMVGMHLNRFL